MAGTLFLVPRDRQLGDVSERARETLAHSDSSPRDRASR